jgi:hypothetical protein
MNVDMCFAMRVRDAVGDRINSINWDAVKDANDVKMYNTIRCVSK